MTDGPVSPRHMRAALFVDFDNIYLGLHNEDPKAAEQFATHPGRWLQWLQTGLASEAGRPRKILLRRCYLNPSQFSRFRPYFIRSAFEVVDCPPLTRGGKTSADIQMVMDVLDALGHTTVFEEFIILSGDADFTPVLLRLSKHDRRSVVLAAGPASAAYKAACDLLIDQDTFLEEAIGVTEGATVRPGASSELLGRIAEKVRERATTGADLVATDLPGIFREFPEFTPDSNWLGFYSLRGMANAVVRTRRDLEMVDGDPWRVRVRSDWRGEGEIPDDELGPIEAAAPPSRPYYAASSAPNGSSTAPPELLLAIANKIYERASAVGELLATDLPGIYREFPEFTPTSNWLGFYSLRGMSSAVIRSRKDLEMVDGDPWRVRVHPLAPVEPGAEVPAGEELEEAGAAGVAGAAAPGAAGAPGERRPVAEGHRRLAEEILDYTRLLLDESDAPISVAKAAQQVTEHFGNEVLATRWAGAGTYRDLLSGREALGFSMTPSRPGFLYDPDRHQVPHEGSSDELDLGDPELSSLSHRVHRITDTPYLTPEEYALVFRKVAEEINKEGYFLTRTSKAVRDRCIEEGTPIARISVNFILRGITSAGYRFDPNGQNSPAALANAFVKNVLGLCESAGLPISEDESEKISEWIAGGLGEEAQTAPEGQEGPMGPMGTAEGKPAEEAAGAEAPASQEGTGDAS